MDSKYEKLRKIGIGSYGVVFKCVNRHTGQTVAIKRYSENEKDLIIRKIAVREVRMLRQLKHPNLINLIEVFRRKKRLHLVFDYCELTVLDVIEKYRQDCPANLIKKIVWQTTNAVNYCHSHNCIHRDIKPENILLAQNGVVKLCDFGFARPIVKSNGSDDEAFTDYVATRWYRAPELLIGDVHYNIKIDIWAIGCVTAELMRGEPIWPGKSDIDQLCLISRSLGNLTGQQMQVLTSRRLYDNVSIEHLLERQIRLGDPIEVKIPEKTGASGLNFVSMCLQMDPGLRPTTDDLLRHNYIYPARITQFMRGGGTSRLDGRRTARTPASHKRIVLGSMTNIGEISQPSAKSCYPVVSCVDQPKQPIAPMKRTTVNISSLGSTVNKSGSSTRIPVTASQQSNGNGSGNGSGKNYLDNNKNNNIVNSSLLRERKDYNTNNMHMLQNVNSPRSSRIPKPISLPNI